MWGLSRRELAGLVALFLLTLPAVTPRLYSSDEVQYYAYLRSLWFDRDVSFDNEYRAFYERGVARTAGFAETFLERETPAGRRLNFATLGCAVLWAPFYAAADAGTRLARAGGAAVAADGYSQPYIAAVAYGSAVYGFVAIVLSAGAARLITGTGLGAALVVWLGTPLLFYMYAAPPFSHACSAFAVALFVTVWLHVRRAWTPAGAAALGLAAALMASVREQDVFFAIGPALDFAWPAGARAWVTRDRVRAAAAGAAAFALGYLPQLAAYRALNGHFGPSRLVARKMTWTAPHALEVLFSPAHGFFVWTPLALLAVAGVAALAWRGAPGRADGDARRLGACALAMVAAQVYVSGSVESWTVAGAFGQRRFVALTVLLVLGLAVVRRLAANRPAPARLALAAAAAAAVWWNVALMILFATGGMDRQRLEPRRNAYDAFVTVPRQAPRTVWRYFFDRSSFYQPPAEDR